MYLFWIGLPSTKQHKPGVVSRTKSNCCTCVEPNIWSDAGVEVFFSFFYSFTDDPIANVQKSLSILTQRMLLELWNINPLCSLHVRLSYPPVWIKLQVLNFCFNCKNVKISNIVSALARRNKSLLFIAINWKKKICNRMLEMGRKALRWPLFKNRIIWLVLDVFKKYPYMFLLWLKHSSVFIWS